MVMSFRTFAKGPNKGKNMNLIEKYYNKFNEDKRLKSRHGMVEFNVSMMYIKKYLELIKNNLNNKIISNNINLNKSIKILDVGAGTGRYSIELNNLGYDVTAVEYVKKNLSVLKQNAPRIPAYQGDAMNLKRFKDNTFDAVVLFGPMYHLFTLQDKLIALKEAKRVTKKGGIIFVAYLLADYAIIRHGFMDKNIIQNLSDGKLDSNFNLHTSEEDLYSYIRLSQIEELNKQVNLTRLEIISPDGPTDYIRPYINKLSEEEFKLYIEFIKQNSNNPSMLGASSHVVDILQNN